MVAPIARNMYTCKLQLVLSSNSTTKLCVQLKFACRLIMRRYYLFCELFTSTQISFNQYCKKQHKVILNSRHNLTVWNDQRIPQFWFTLQLAFNAIISFLSHEGQCYEVIASNFSLFTEKGSAVIKTQRKSLSKGWKVNSPRLKWLRTTQRRCWKVITLFIRSCCRSCTARHFMAADNCTFISFARRWRRRWRGFCIGWGLFAFLSVHQYR